ncbi:MAG: hypothetical protein CMJ18_11190 [Phycisphaeraceae bacterium]|nr:hypothetical protein [Phycisphaeraceae bacterium]
MNIRLLGQVCILSSLVIAQVGCKAVAELRRIERPSIQITGVEVHEQTDEGTLVHVLVDVENPNDVALPVVASNYTVQLDDMVFAFNARPKRTLPARSRQQIAVPAVFDTTGREVDGMTYRVRGRLTYQPPGQLRRFLTESHIPLPTMQYSGTGTLSR